MSTIWASIQDRWTHFIQPWLFMSISARHIPLTVRTLLANGSYATLLSLDAFCDALFGQFWATVGPQVKTTAEVRVIPLLEGRVTRGVARGEVVGVPVGGTVIEIGPGTGNWVDVFLKIDTEPGHARGGAGEGETPSRGSLTKIYGVEPNHQSAAALRQRVKDIGLDDIYEVIPLGIESLSDPNSPYPTTIEPGSVDSIVSVLCLCSIPDQEENIKTLYKLLKPGGRWYVYEHVKVTRGGPVLAIYQRMVNFVWAFFLGSCRLCHPTGEHLRNAGPWSEIDVAQPPDEPSYQLLPHILGTFTK